MRTQTLIRALLLLIAAGSLVSCQKVAHRSPYDVNPDYDAEGGGIAHTDEFKNTALHGTRYLLGQTSCFSCHDGMSSEEMAELQRGRPGGPRERDRGKKACAACHENFPHGKRFARTHGELYFNDPQSCLKCHGQKQEGRGRAVSCATCHEASHTTEFKMSRMHGAKFLEERRQAGSGGSISCWKCHTDKKPRDQSDGDARSETGRGVKRSCAVCHENFPHPKNFDDSKKHAKAFRDNPADCATCHGRDFEGAGGSSSCKDCHDFPHGGSWGLPSRHGQAFMKELQGEGAMVGCTDCHTKDAKVSCNTCHFWHLPFGLQPKIQNSRKVRNGCTNCHTDGVRLMPESYQGGCYACHLGNTEPRVPRDWETRAPDSGRSPQSVPFENKDDYKGKLKKAPLKKADKLKAKTSK